MIRFIFLSVDDHVKITINLMGEEGILWDEKQRQSFNMIQSSGGSLCFPFSVVSRPSFEDTQYAAAPCGSESSFLK